MPIALFSTCDKWRRLELELDLDRGFSCPSRFQSTECSSKAADTPGKRQQDSGKKRRRDKQVTKGTKVLNFRLTFGSGS
ncbi:uncharacterized protein Dsimw501_GD28189 [Drosophila simulans]|nr:uncharacterized protein Dsimw501_GD28189 [Drosophila simulans]